MTSRTGSTPRIRREVGRLGAALNGMLTRIEAAIDEHENGKMLVRRFLADASHELRTPLASLRANAQLYQQGALPLSEPGQPRPCIALEAERMSRLVDDMRRLARLEQQPEPVDLSVILSECLEQARIAGPARTWQTRIAPDLVSVGDEELLGRAVDILVANVLTHTPDETVATVTAAGTGSSVVVEVSDDGPGVPVDRLPHIFDRFYRAGGQTPRPGSGLGLAIVAEIANAHGGTAAATPDDPHGLRVTLLLPAPSSPPRWPPPPTSHVTHIPTTRLSKGQLIALTS